MYVCIYTHLYNIYTYIYIYIRIYIYIYIERERDVSVRTLGWNQPKLERGGGHKRMSARTYPTVV